MEKVFKKEYSNLKNIISNALLKNNHELYQKALFFNSVEKFNNLYKNYRADLSKTIPQAKEKALEKTIEYAVFESNSRKWDSDPRDSLRSN